jgi:hypothetical protein
MLLGCVRTRRLRLRGGNLAVAAVPRAPTTVMLTATATATTTTTATTTAASARDDHSGPSARVLQTGCVGVFDNYDVGMDTAFAALEEAVAHDEARAEQRRNGAVPTPLEARRGEDPLNDYDGATEATYDAFWHIFILRQGRRAMVPVTPQVWRRVFLHASCRPAHSELLLVHAAVCLMRHSVNSGVSAGSLNAALSTHVHALATRPDLLQQSCLVLHPPFCASPQRRAPISAALCVWRFAPCSVPPVLAVMFFTRYPSSLTQTPRSPRHFVLCARECCHTGGVCCTRFLLHAAAACCIYHCCTLLYSSTIDRSM